MAEFQSWLDKAECVTDLPIQPDHREQLNTALKKVQVEPFFKFYYYRIIVMIALFSMRTK